ncbi:hypothetical protein GQX74_007962 [Glossina fuscipes]|nr:hypothetical protein GQX74_007962 [Glossina fuscipes]
MSRLYCFRLQYQHYELHSWLVNQHYEYELNLWAIVDLSRVVLNLSCAVYATFLLKSCKQTVKAIDPLQTDKLYKSQKLSKTKNSVEYLNIEIVSVMFIHPSICLFTLLWYYNRKTVLTELGRFLDSSFLTASNLDQHR